MVDAELIRLLGEVLAFRVGALAWRNSSDWDEFLPAKGNQPVALATFTSAALTSTSAVWPDRGKPDRWWC
ncbi:hypothetical protein NKH49_18615 [Mesorhizobium sp. M1088]|uniref:hypothetical protein n=1 Tax=Mesorhizobium sp. M1088 TaxID=2957056 RepID=UPI003339C873